jgi:hypothetical protein
LLWPTYIDRVSPAQVSETLAILLRGRLRQVRGGGGGRRFIASKIQDETARAALGGESTEAERRRSLLALADDAQTDGLVTADSVLIERRYDLLQHHRLRIVPISEFADAIEVVAHGHSIFWTAADSGRRITNDTYYQMHHWKQKRLARWYWTKGPSLESDLRDNVHSALINRYGLIAYTRDMVRFYELQLDHFHRRGLGRRFGTLLGYYLTDFYLYLWGMMEHLTTIANQVKQLGLRERRCGIDSAEFWEAFGERDPALRAYIRSGPIRDWIGRMADVRHAAAHRAMLLPTDMMRETEESQKTNAEIAAILRVEEPNLYAVLPETMLEIFEPMAIEHWRHGKRQTLATNVVMVTKESNSYFRFAVNSIDYDLGMLNAVIDAFLVKLFSSQGEGSSPRGENS